MIILHMASLPALAQGVPKAYEVINYQGGINGHRVKFLLANGYIGASSLKVYLTAKAKFINFEPDKGAADEHDRLKFVASLQNRRDYFVLGNMQEAYDTPPRYINGTYFLANRKMRINLWLVRKTRHS